MAAAVGYGLAGTQQIASNRARSPGPSRPGRAVANHSLSSATPAAVAPADGAIGIACCADTSGR